MNDVLTINGINMNEHGIFLDDTSMSALMTPSALKENVTSRSRLEHGQRAVVVPKYEAREFTIVVQFAADTHQEFLEKYAYFCGILAGGVIDIQTAFQPNVEYHCRYLGCNQFSEFIFGIAKFTLRLIEDNPSDRTVKTR